MEWVDGLPKDLEQCEKAARQVEELKDAPLSDLSRLLDKLNDSGWVVRAGRRPFLRRLFDGRNEDTEATVAAAGLVEGLEDLPSPVFEELLSKLAAAGLVVAERGE